MQLLLSLFIVSVLYSSEIVNSSQTFSFTPKTGAKWGEAPPELYDRWNKMKNQRRLPSYVEKPKLSVNVSNGSFTPEPGRIHIINRTTLPLARNSGDLWLLKLYV